ncbi:hypothetical protein QBC34DRAFT_309571 [Podospora aff. communis PSN243]|uniref:CENP-V/GFA domain-containing protein n=1 Tax=Podospora aff. communis PSN243 TaxID=3040156 RepID=A0AAV9GA31_9PEZI|nr:hypothetical protein QBC34DRAFT_309571 [Podospora aff. communis PSN243]
MPGEDIAVTAHCLCKAHIFTTTVPSSSLPLPASCCHCDSCRHTTGALYLPCTPWPNREVDLSALKRYPFSPNIDYLSCPTCSTLLFCKGTQPGDIPEVVTGSLVNAPKLVKYSHHGFVSDTLDGGATAWFANDPSGNPIPRWSGSRDKSEQLPPSWPPHTSKDPKPKATPTLTPLKCHCGGVDLLIRSAADWESRHSPDSPLPWFIDPKTYRYFAAFDSCDSCRLSFSSDIVNWTFVELDHIHFPGSSSEGGEAAGSLPPTVDALKSAVLAKDKDPRLGKLALYQSSDDVERYFCAGCSASVFYAVHEDGRRDMVDVAVGLLKHVDGARAEGLLTWNWGVVGWMEDVAGGWREGLVKRVVDDAEAWRVGRGLEKSWRRVMREEAAKRAVEEGS